MVGIICTNVRNHWLFRKVAPSAYGFAGVQLLTQPPSMAVLSTVQSWPKPIVAALAMATTLFAGVAGGMAAGAVHLPLPWLLGALVATMTLSLAGAPVRLIPWGRPAGTVVVGASTGLQFTAAVVAKLVTLLPLIIGAAFISTLVGASRRSHLYATHRHRSHHRILRHRAR